MRDYSLVVVPGPFPGSEGTKKASETQQLGYILQYPNSLNRRSLLKRSFILLRCPASPT